MLVRPMLLHRMALVSVRLFCKNLGNLQEFFGQMVYRPPWQKIARTPMVMIRRLRHVESGNRTNSSPSFFAKYIVYQHSLKFVSVLANLKIR